MENCACLPSNEWLTTCAGLSSPSFRITAEDSLSESSLIQLERNRALILRRVCLNTVLIKRRDLLPS